MKISLTIISLALLVSAPETGTADDGRIYGTVTTREGSSITGAIRWSDEEVFWTDHFNGQKAHATDLSKLSEDDRETILDQQPGPQLEINGNVVELIKIFGSDTLEPQIFYLEFGSISSIEPLGGDMAKITLRDGSHFEADGGSNDIPSDIVVRGEDGTVHEIDWDDIDTVAFAAGSENAPSFGDHLYGTVKTEVGDFQGIVQWDHDERVGSEKLDGEVDGNDVSIEFGNIVSITKENKGSRVITRDEANLYITGTNDVNDQNRGIYVDDPRFGRVDIEWEQFISVHFSRNKDHRLATYADFANVGRLRGTVVDVDGNSTTGSLIYDVDEWVSGEMIRGLTKDGLKYMIPLRLVRSITRDDEKSAVIKLIGGQEMTLHGNRDVNHKNNGIIIDAESEHPKYIEWKRVKSIDF